MPQDYLKILMCCEPISGAKSPVANSAFDQLAGCGFRVGVGASGGQFMLQLGDFACVGKSWFGSTAYIDMLNQRLWISIMLRLEPLHDPNRY